VPTRNNIINIKKMSFEDEFLAFLKSMD